MTHNGFDKECDFCRQKIDHRDYVQRGKYYYHSRCWHRLSADQKFEREVEEFWKRRSEP